MKASVTAGLRCAPETGANIAISTTRIAPVAAVLHSNASATLPPESCSAMMPEPTIAARRKAAPTPSAARRRARLAGAIRLGRLFRSIGAGAPDIVEMSLERQSAQTGDRQIDEDRDALGEHPEAIVEGKGLLRFGAYRLGRIGQPPMGAHRLPRPYWASFLRGVVADGEHEIELGRAGCGKLIPRLGAELRHVVIGFFQQVERQRMDVAERLAAGAIGVEFTAPEAVQDALGHDRARGVAGAKKENV